MPLPPYSPDLTQISEMFSKLKGWLRSAAARTTEAVCPADIRGCFSSYGLCNPRVNRCSNAVVWTQQ